MLSKTKSDDDTIPILKALLPETSDLIPFLKKIDGSSRYSNFGPLSREFENSLSELYQDLVGDEASCLVVSNGTSGLTLALRELELPPKSGVLVPAFTFVATALAVKAAGHVPIACDIDVNTWLLTPESIEPTIRNLKKSIPLKAVVPVSIFGATQDISVWDAFYRRTGIKVVIDAAASFGNQTASEDVTTVFSLHATKPLSCGEGGAIFSKSLNRLNRLRKLSNFGFGMKNNGNGYNCKISEFTAAVGLAATLHFKANAKKRRALYENLKNKLSGQTEAVFEFQNIRTPFAPSIFCLKAKSEAHREAVERDCWNQNIETRRWYLPLLQTHSALDEINVPVETPNADQLAKRLFGIPFFPTMQDKEIDRVLTCITNS